MHFYAAPVITAERSLQEPGSYNSTPVKYNTTTMLVVPIIAAIVGFGIGAVVGLMIPRCKKFRNNKKLTKIPSKNAVFPNGTLRNGVSNGSTSPLTSEKPPMVIPMQEFNLNLDEDSQNSSPQRANSQFCSQTLPSGFKVKRTYL